ncbi:synaptic vesicular amine transporter isoform X1 [Musca domestica]|uniref:Synaptic vesicular amine transporter isoform X1 n=1 Tax=Musca domestica TaxID=7370 RepID=A0A9J7DKM2_MUSDO|nr:synaptic vesicular amine transporter isoform X1 [Musca domestica]XP_011293999.2 synaptic vesicular amine transporter isoform X1 [Musca domestica]XP_011294000.2 synaptic vesicular amine transporter isoform X1 [Musca domestica]XP_011294001.2 synaptic vesicular amine transporter isoform X1 [Musca domestica]XP_011294006.2 synaptic vesicular amine transporter isoform X1 [Musca domestica]XP_019893607.2 synaptic vesicular amine transporter isoform X1 [Musca domestica]
MKSSEAGGGELRQQQHKSSLNSTAAAATAASNKTGLNESTTSFTTNTPNSTALNNDTPSKNPFKQHLQTQQQQQNGSSNNSSDGLHASERGTSYGGILGVGATTPADPKMTSPPGGGGRAGGGAGPPLPPPDHHRQEDYRAAGSWAAFKNWMIGWRGSSRLVLVIVAIALLLDNMLLTTVVPIIPEFLYDIRHPDAPLDSYPRTPLSIHVPPTPTPSPCSKDGDDVSAMVEVSTLSPEENETLYRELEERHQELVGETVEVGLLFASKAFVQLLVNPIVGPLTHRIGYSIPMFAGFVIMFVSTLIFAFGRSYTVLFIARALQGIGSSCSSVSGMGMLADRFTDDKERGNAMGIALGGLALGVLIGPPFGGVMYEFVGKSAPFLVLSVLALGDGLLQLFMLQPSIEKAETEPPTLKALISDPYILIAAGSITFANMGIAMLEPSLPLWMLDNMGSSRWEQGVAFLPASVSYLIGTNLFGPLGHKIGRWFAACLGLVIIGGCLIMIPMATSITHLIIPNAGLGFAIGMVDSSMMPELGYLVDIRHSAVYGSVYALGDVAFCLGFAVGPALSGTLVKTIGFEWMLFGIAIICFLYAPLLTLLKNPPTREEKKVGSIADAPAANEITTVHATSPAIINDGVTNPAFTESERL